jgi:hypothetical protein
MKNNMDLSILPKQLHARAVILCNEAAWHKQDARAVVEFLSRNGYAVIDVELWIPEGSVPRVIGWSDYDIAFSGDWDRYVQLNAQSAMNSLDQATTDNELFNLTWIGRDRVE